MKTPQERLDIVLNEYICDCRYLIKAKVDFPRAEGIFKIEDTFYANPRTKLKHMTDIEAKFCLNQLCYAAFGEWIMEKRLEHFTTSFEEYLGLMHENVFIIESNIRFKKPISTESPINGVIEVKKIKRVGRLYLAFLDYDIGDGKSKGKIEAALKGR
ncbi:hypothetical protein KY348_01715 [Candidatus Woesearchaeota archaeon]|nr:hypothetical protein [Candidatus Woesearchaeota archaeon]